MARHACDALQIVHAVAERIHRARGQSCEVHAAGIDLRVLREQPIEDRHRARLAHGGEGRVLSRAPLPLDRREHDRVLRGDLDPPAAFALNARVVAVAVQHDDQRHGFRRGAPAALRGMYS